MSSPYDRRYRNERAWVLGGGPVCTYCGRPMVKERNRPDSETTDHQPPLAQHEHVPRTGCCELVPCCLRCNTRMGGRIGAGRSRRGRVAWPQATREW